MANEAVVVELLGDQGDVIEYTVASGTTIAKCTLLQLADERTASASDGENVFAGIASTEKDGSDYSTTLGAYTYGVFDLVSADDTISVGAIVSLSGANLVKTATEAEIAAGKGIGKALETASNGETFQVLVGRCC